MPAIPFDTVAAGATAVLLLDTSAITLRYGVDIFADPDNTEPVYIGVSSAVDIGDGGAGVAVHPGKLLSIPENLLTGDSRVLYCISAAEDQLVSYQVK
jgi:hypothetical protein